MNITERIEIARGERPAALVIKRAGIFHLTTGEYESADIAIDGDGVIAAVGKDYQGEHELDANGLVAVPGFIDSHVHIESSMLTPQEYERCVLKHGVTTAVCDPHELADVVGPAAFDYFFACAAKLTMDLRVRLSSCVPATDMETAGAAVTTDDLAKYHKKHPEAALAELMNVPGVLARNPEVMKKLALFDFIDGHCPLLSGRNLNAYIAAGVRNCHESTLLAEAQEKIKRGMQVLIREGSAARNLTDLMPLITVANSPFIAFCTDDRDPVTLLESGSINGMVARAIAAGAEPLAAYRAASWSAARGLRLYDRGLIAPGQRADIVLLSDLKACSVVKVIVQGKIVSENTNSQDTAPCPDSFRQTVKCRQMTAEDFSSNAKGNVHVIGVKDGSLVTEHLYLPCNTPDLLSVAVIERHGKNGNIAKGFVKGFGLSRGAIASSVGHDSHNLCVVGTTPEDMAVAVNALRESQGGFAVADRGAITGLLPLPIAGLFCDQPAEKIAARLQDTLKAARDIGCTLAEPFLQLTFIPLPVIPHLKLTDMGLVDVDRFEVIQ